MADMKVSPYILRATALASLGGILYGYDLGVISGALPSLVSSLDLSDAEAESVVSFLYLGSIIGSIIGGAICDAAGRRAAILLTDATFLIGAVILAAAPGLGVVLVGRVVVGIAVSVSGIADVSYLTEISPEGHRGALVSCNEACISLGFLLAYGFSYLVTVSNDFDGGWRIMFAMSGIIAFIQAVGMACMPESPKWLLERGRDREAREALERINGNGSNFAPVVTDGVWDATFTNENNNESVLSEGPGGSPLEIQRSNHATNSDDVVSSSDMANNMADSTDTTSPPAFAYNEGDGRNPSKINWRDYKRHAIVGIFLATSQQFCGNVNILNFAPAIFSDVFYGEDAYEPDIDDDALINYGVLLAPMLLLGAIKFLVTLVVIINVDRFGRRPLLLSGIGLIAVSLLCLTVAFSTGLPTPGKDDDSTKEDSYGKAQQVLAFLGCVGVVSGYSLSFGPLTWLITSELFPVSVRGRALGVSSILSAASAALISYTFLSGQNLLGQAAPFVLYSVISVASWAFVFLGVPDTGIADAGGDGEAIDRAFDQMWFWGKSGQRCCCCPSGVEIVSESLIEEAVQPSSVII